LQVALVTPGDRFVLRPYAVGEPFGRPPSPSFALADIAREQHARFVRDRIAAVHPEERVVVLEQGAEMPYDALLLAIGARARSIHPDVVTFTGPQSVAAVRHLIDDLTHGRAASVAVIVPSGVSWPLPMYELALLIRARAQTRDVTLVTSEPAPLSIFGAEPSRAVAALLKRAGIRVHTGVDPQVGDDGRSVGLSATGPWLPVDRVVAPPLLTGPRISGVPSDAGGFIPVDEHGRVSGLDRVYAAGDGTDAPMKQGGLAAQQAYAAVRHIASQAGGPLPPEAFRPVLRGRLLTGGVDRYLRHDPDAGDSVLDEPLWEPATKVVGHHLAPWLAYQPGHSSSAAPAIEVDRELSLDPLSP
jgi:sulfide:quinone oxidoreductase